jgi:hypothetical protein
MNKAVPWLLLSTIVIVAAFLWMPRPPSPQTPAAVTPAPTPDSTPEGSEPLTRFPVPPAAENGTAQAPLPALNDSDPALLDSLARLSDAKRLGELFIFKDLIRRLVVTADNLPRSKLPQRDLPTPPLAGEFQVKPQGIGQAEIDPSNYRRYDGYVNFITGLDMRRLAAVYFRFYPLFQQAYADLGYPKAYFNDRLIAVIDDLLAAPRLDGPVALVQPAVAYKYADPKLEALSAGQKLMIRIGPDNAERVKAKLRELRRALTARDTHSPS